MKSIKKRIMALVMSLCMIVSVFPTTVLAVTEIPIEGTALQYHFELSEMDEVTGEIFQKLVISINPDSESDNFDISGRPWTSANMVQEVVIKEGVTGIGDNAFSNMTNLETLTIENPSLITSIGDSAFSGDSRLEIDNLDLSSVMELGEGAFRNCSNISGTLTLSSELTEIPNSAFYNCGFSSVSIPDSVEKIGDSAFYSNNLTTIAIPSNVTEVGSSAFASNSIASIILNDGLVTIGSGAFQYNPLSMTSLVIPNSVTTIGGSAFRSSGTNTALTELTIGSGVTTIGEYAFFSYTQLSKVLVEATGLKEVGNSAFGTNEYNAYSTTAIDEDTGARYSIGADFMLVDGVNSNVFKNGENCYLGERSPLQLTDYKEPTCEEEGYYEYTFYYNGQEKGPIYEYIDALGHAWDSGSYKPATCETDGYTLYTCTRDSRHTETRNTKPDGSAVDKATGHEYVVKSVSNRSGASDSYVMSDTNTITITYECQKGGHDHNDSTGEGRDTRNKTVVISLPNTTLKGDTDDTLATLNMPITVSSGSQTLGTISWASGVNTSENLTAGTKDYPVTFTPNNVTYAGYTGMAAVSSFDGKDLKIEVSTDRAELDFTNVRFGGTLAFINAERPTPVTVNNYPLQLGQSDFTVQYRNKNTKVLQSDPPTSSTPDENDTVWEVVVTFTYDSSKYYVNPSKGPSGTDISENEYSFDVNENGASSTVVITHDYRFIMQSFDLARAEAVSAVYDDGNNVKAIHISGIPAGTTINYSWTSNNHGSGSNTTTNDKEGQEDLTQASIYFTEADTYTVTITLSKANYEDKTLTAVETTVNQKTVNPPAAAVNLQYTGLEQQGLVESESDKGYYTITDDSNYSSKATNAGNYVAKAVLINDNYVWAQGTSLDENNSLAALINWSIAKRPIIQTTNIYNNSSIAYDGAVKTAVGEPATASKLFTFEYNTDGSLVADFDYDNQEGSTDGIKDDDVFTITNARQTDVGEYKVTATIAESYRNNFYWSNREGNTELYVIDMGTWEISSAQVAAPRPTVSGKVYDGTAYDPSTAITWDYSSFTEDQKKAIAEGDLSKIKYNFYTQVSGGTSLSNLPVNAGTYYVYVDFSEAKSGNYTLTGNARIPFVIERATLTLTGQTDTKDFVNGTSYPIPNPTVSGFVGADANKSDEEKNQLYTFTYTYDTGNGDETTTSRPSFQNAGTYKVTVGISENDNGNYKAAASVECTLTINAGEQSITLSPSAGTNWDEGYDGTIPDNGYQITKTFGDSDFTVTGTPAISNDSGASISVKYSVVNSTPANIISLDSGSGAVAINGAGEVTIKASTDSTNNVDAAEASYKLIINKADPTLDFNSDVDGTITTKFTGSAIAQSVYEASLTGVTGKIEPTGSVTYRFYESVEAAEADNDGTGGEPGITNVGDHWVKAFYNGDTNYNAVSATAKIEVESADISVETEGYSGTYDGNGHVNDIQFTVKDLAGGGEGTAIGSDNYTVYFMSKSLSSDKPSADNANWKTAAEITENNEMKDATLDSDGTVKADEYWFKIVTNDGNHAPYIGSFKVTIEPAKFTLTNDIEPEKAYDGNSDVFSTSQSTSLIGNIADGNEIPGSELSSIKVSVSAQYGTVSDGGFTADGTAGDKTIRVVYEIDFGNLKPENYKYVYSGDGTGEYNNGTVTETMSGKITASQVVIDVLPQSAVYTGTKPDVNTEENVTWKFSDSSQLKPTDLGVSLSLAEGYDTNGNVGNYDITVSWTNKNYSVSVLNGTGTDNLTVEDMLTVTQRPVTLKIGGTSCYYGEEPDYSDVPLEDVTEDKIKGGIVGDENIENLPNVKTALHASYNGGYITNETPASESGYAIAGETVSQGFGNYTVDFTTDGSSVYVINKRPIIIDANDNITVKYESGVDDAINPANGIEYAVSIDTEKAPDLSGKEAVVNNDDLGISLKFADETVNDSSGVGDYVVKAQYTSGGDADNYDITLKDGKLTIEPAELAVEFTESSATVPFSNGTYTNPLIFLNSSNNNSAVKDTDISEMNVEYISSNSGVATVTNNGTVNFVSTGLVTIGARVTPNANTNYKNSTVMAQYTLNISSVGAGISVSFEPNPLTYNGSDQQLLDQSHITVTPSNATVLYSLDPSSIADPDGFSDWKSIEEILGKDVGSHTVYYKASAENYTTITGFTTVNINKADLNVKFTNATVNLSNLNPGDIYDGDANNPIVGIPDDYTRKADITYLSSNTGVAIVNNFSENKLTINGDGVTTVRASLPSDNNYNDAYAEYTISIGQSEMEYTSSGYTGEFDNKSHGITLSVTNPDSGYIVEYSYSTDNGNTYSTPSQEAPEFRDAGEYIVKYSISANGYTPVNEQTEKVTITQKPLMADMFSSSISQNGYTYTGKEITFNVIVTDTETDYTLNSDEYTVTFENNIDVGTGSVTVTAAENGNYSGSATADFRINPLDANYLTAYLTSYYGYLGDDGNNSTDVEVRFGTRDDLVNGQDYEIICDTGVIDGNTITFSNVGIHDITVNGLGNFQNNSVTLKYALITKDLQNGLVINGGTGFIIAEYGEPINGDLDIKIPGSDEQLTQGVDYNLTYEYYDYLGNPATTGEYTPDVLSNGSGMYIITAETIESAKIIVPPAENMQNTDVINLLPVLPENGGATGGIENGETDIKDDGIVDGTLPDGELNGGDISDGHENTENNGSDGQENTGNEGSEGQENTGNEGSEGQEDTGSDDSEGQGNSGNEGSEGQENTGNEGSEDQGNSGNEGSEGQEDTGSEGSEDQDNSGNEDSEGQEDTGNEDSENQESSESENSGEQNNSADEGSENQESSGSEGSEGQENSENNGGSQESSENESDAGEPSDVSYSAMGITSNNYVYVLMGDEVQNIQDVQTQISYSGTGQFIILILQKDLANANVSVGTPEYNYGTALEPEFDITFDDGTPIDKENDVDVRYINNINAGENTGTLIVTASPNSNNFTGSNMASFSITPVGFTVDSIEPQDYTGSPVTPSVTVRNLNGDVIPPSSYTVQFENNVEPGTASAIVTGYGNYTGTITTEFTINASETHRYLDMSIGKTSWTYDGNANAESITVTYDEKELVIGSDYIITIAKGNGSETTYLTETDAINAMIEVGTYTVTAVGSGSYAGLSDTETVTINEKSSGGGGGGGGGGGTTTYTITASASENGYINPEGQVKVSSGDDERFVIAAKDGYVISDVIVDGESVGPVSTYLFENVRENHTIEAVFSAEGESGQPGTGGNGENNGNSNNPSDSGNTNSTDSTGVSKWLNTKDHFAYLNGYPERTFKPDGSMTRAEAAQMFYNLLLDKSTVYGNRFDDVPSDAWYSTAVNTLSALGMISGVGNNKYEPERSITRAEFTSIAMRFADATNAGENIFTDVHQNDWYYNFVVGSIKYGWISGYPDGTFRPNNTITRAEVTSIVNRMLNRNADNEYINRNKEKITVFSDVSKEHWAYYIIAEATNSHDYTKANGVERWSM